MNPQRILLISALILTVLLASGIAFYLNQPADQKNPDNTTRVACVGDSITRIHATEGLDYPACLSRLLGSGYSVRNFGVSGAAVSSDSPASYTKKPEFEAAKRFQPDIVIVMLGTNDASVGLQKFNASFVSDYLKLIGEFQALESHPQIWAVKPPPIFNNGTGLSTPFFDSVIIPKIGEAAEQANLPVIDVYAALADASDVFFDGVHPDGDGAQLIAEVVHNSIVQR